ncbi:MAG: WecB/TagA/CpsF family glycosyltransferase [Akkermansia sp.]
MSSLARETVFGVPLVAASFEEAVPALLAIAESPRRPLLIAHADVHVLTRMLRDADYGRGMQGFDYICPDGMPLVWILRRKGAAAAQRLYGSAMMEQMWQQGAARGLRHFLLGSTESTCARLQERLCARFPGAIVAGHYCPPMPPWPEGEDERMLAALRDSGADCVWVGLGCPRQERWLFTHRDALPPALYFAVGAAFDFHAGMVRQAPEWMRNHGLEWLYRIFREPRRLLRRYLVHNSLFLWYCLTRRF